MKRIAIRDANMFSLALVREMHKTGIVPADECAVFFFLFSDLSIFHIFHQSLSDAWLGVYLVGLQQSDN